MDVKYMNPEEIKREVSKVNRDIIYIDKVIGDFKNRRKNLMYRLREIENLDDRIIEMNKRQTKIKFDDRD